MFQTFPDFIISQNLLWLLFKALYVIGALLYVGFAVVVITQVRRMVATVKGPVDGLIQLITWVHMVLAILSFLAALVLL